MVIAGLNEFRLGVSSRAAMAPHLVAPFAFTRVRQLHLGYPVWDIPFESSRLGTSLWRARPVLQIGC